MANSGVLDRAHMEDMAGIDTISNNTRVRATASNPLGVNYLDGFGTPVSAAPGATVTISAANLLTGIITYSPSAPNTATFDTAANIVAAVNANSAGAVIGDYITTLIINGNGTNAITLAAGTNGSFDTNQATRTIPVNTSKYVLIRLTNVTAGSEAYTIYF
jgi:hypothetical protein